MATGDSSRINTNLAAKNALDALHNVTRNLEKSQLRLATGKRINEVADDPAGFVIARTLTGRSRGIVAAYDNVGTVKNALAIAEGGLMTISNTLIHMKEKVTQAATDTYGTPDRSAIKAELDHLALEITDIVEETIYNKTALLDGTYSASYQTGEATISTMIFSIDQDIRPEALSIDAPNVSEKIFTAAGASIALANVNNAITAVSDVMQKIGAVISRMDVKESTLTTSLTNTDATRSRIEDADLAREQMISAKYQILQQTGTAQLAQANVSPQYVMALFG